MYVWSCTEGSSSLRKITFLAGITVRQVCPVKARNLRFTPVFYICFSFQLLSWGYICVLNIQQLINGRGLTTGHNSKFGTKVFKPSPTKSDWNFLLFHSGRLEKLIQIHSHTKKVWSNLQYTLRGSWSARNLARILVIYVCPTSICWYFSVPLSNSIFLPRGNRLCSWLPNFNAFLWKPWVEGRTSDVPGTPTNYRVP